MKDTSKLVAWTILLIAIATMLNSISLLEKHMPIQRGCDVNNGKYIAVKLIDGKEYISMWDIDSVTITTWTIQLKEDKGR